MQQSYSIGQTLRALGVNPKNNGRYPWIKRLIVEYGIDTSHFTGKGWRANSVKYSTDEAFAAESTKPRGVIRQWVIRYSLIPYECAFCGNKGEWNGHKMALELDHINGIPNDHRLENLRFLCPNCHAITDTYCGRNKDKDGDEDNSSLQEYNNANIWVKKKKEQEEESSEKQQKRKKKPEYFCKNCGKPLKSNCDYCRPCSQRRVLQRPSAIEIAQKVKEKGFWRGAKDYGVTDNAVRKWCKEYGIPIHTKDLISWLDSQDQ